jgi:hypothetical protein
VANQGLWRNMGGELVLSSIPSREGAAGQVLERGGSAAGRGHSGSIMAMVNRKLHSTVCGNGLHTMYRKDAMSGVGILT